MPEQAILALKLRALKQGLDPADLIANLIESVFDNDWEEARVAIANRKNNQGPGG